MESETAHLFCRTPGAFCQKVADTRNYYTHYSAKLKDVAVSGTDMFWLCQRLRILLMVALFRELGIDESTIRQRISNHPKLKQIIHQANESLRF